MFHGVLTRRVFLAAVLALNPFFFVRRRRACFFSADRRAPPNAAEVAPLPSTPQTLGPWAPPSALSGFGGQSAKYQIRAPKKKKKVRALAPDRGGPSFRQTSNPSSRRAPAQISNGPSVYLGCWFLSDVAGKHRVTYFSFAIGIDQWPKSNNRIRSTRELNRHIRSFALKTLPPLVFSTTFDYHLC